MLRKDKKQIIDSIDEVHSVITSTQQQQNEVLSEQSDILKELKDNGECLRQVLEKLEKSHKNEIFLKRLGIAIVILLTLQGVITFKDALQAMTLLFGLS